MNNESFTHNIRFELVNLLFQQISLGLWAESLAVLGFTAAMWGAVNESWLIFWAVSNLLVCGLGRHIMVACYKKEIARYELTQKQMTFWLYLFLAGAFCSGISWGATGSFLMVHNDMVRQTFAIFLLVGTASAANSLYSSVRKVYVAFLLPAFIPLIIWLILQGGMFIMLAGLAAIYVVIMLTTSFYSNLSIATALRLGFENLSLVENLSKAKTDLEKYSQELEKSTFESTNDGILVVNAEKHIENYNKKFLEMWKIAPHMISKGTVPNENLKQAIYDQLISTEEFMAKIERLYASKTSESFDEISLKDGRVYERYSQPRYIGKKYVGRVWCFRDITGRKLLESRLYHQANFDPLTGLPNRVLVLDRLSQALLYAKRSASQVAILFLDLDRFKFINDTFGHAYGDKMLETVAERLSACVRSNDTVSRVGGDEFLIILTMLNNIDSSIEVARKCLVSIREPIIIEGNRFNISISIGISIFPRDGLDAEVLIRNADVAMYHSKELGRNTFQFYMEEMNKKVHTRLTIENYLSDALKHDELFVMYQPIVNLKTGTIVGMEALLRWDHPELGSVSPTDFISVAEESGMIVPIGEWVLRAACKQLHEWHKNGFEHLYISVNLSARQFKQANLFEIINGILKESQLNPARLALELTETVIMDDIEMNIKTLNRLKKMGIMIAIDDFGIGYSSLNYLKQLPVDKLKIDISFIKDINLHVDGAAITAAIIALAAKLNLKVIAEGVEDDEQLSFLMLHRCDEIQGYYFSKPLDVDVFTKMLHANKVMQPPS